MVSKKSKKAQIAHPVEPVAQSPPVPAVASPVVCQIDKPIKQLEKSDIAPQEDVPSTQRSEQFELVRRIGNEYKNRANDLFKANHFLRARDAYNEAIRVYASTLTFGSSTRVDPVLYLNRGFVSLKLLQYIDADEDFTTALIELETLSDHYSVLEAITYSLKCLWRRSDARKQLKRYVLALQDLHTMIGMVEMSSIVSHKDIIVKIKDIQACIQPVIQSPMSAPANSMSSSKPATPTIASAAAPRVAPRPASPAATKRAAPIPATKQTVPVTMHSNGNIIDKIKKPARDETFSRVISEADVKSFLQKSEEDVHALITRDVHHLISKAQLRNLSLPEATDDHLDCGKDPTPEILNYFRMALQFDMNNNDGVLGFIKCVNTMIPFFEGNCSRGAELFVKIRGFESMSKEFIFIPKTASTILDLFCAVAMCFDSDKCKDQLLPSVISVSLHNFDIERLQLLVSFLNMTIVDKPVHAQEFYDVVTSATGSKLLTVVNEQVYFSSTLIDSEVLNNVNEYNLMQDFLHLIGKFFAFSPSWLQRKFSFNLKQTITLVSFALVADHFDELFFMDLMMMIRDICRYIEMRNGSGLMPIKSKKLFDDIHEISSTLATQLNPMIIGDTLMEQHSYIHIFDSLTVSISILPIPFRDCALYIPNWIAFLHQSDDDDELIDSILCLLHATSKKNSVALEPFIATLQLVYLMNITLGVAQDTETTLSSKLGNHALIGFLHVWFRSSPMELVYKSFMAEGGHMTLCKYLRIMEGEAEADQYDEKYLKTLALATHCLVMLMAFQECRQKLHQQAILPSLNRLSKAYSGESHRLFMTAILNLCKFAMREYEKMDGAAGSKKLKEVLQKNVQAK